jgi:hypothetical protein
VFRARRYRKALNYFARARAAEPFNAKTRTAMRDCLLFSARRRLDAGNLSLARKDYERAEALLGPGESDVSLSCKWAASRRRI